MAAGTLALAAGFGYSPAPVCADGPTMATRAHITASGAATEFTLDLTAGVAAQVYTLAEPYRVVIDLPAVTVQLPPASGTNGKGLVTSYHGETLPGSRSQVVIETAGPVEIVSAQMVNAATGQAAASVRLHVTFKATDPAKFAAGSSAGPPPAATSSNSTDIARSRARAVEAPAVKPAVFDDPATGTKPLIMIDPGHGGIDPGAIGASKLTEKAIVLAVAGHLKAALEATGRFRVAMTRTGDSFVPLDHRVELSRRAQADLFISLHADTIDDRHLAQSIRGASIYTLSDKASNEDAQRMAEKENAADLIAGQEGAGADRSDEVKPILFDLLARETAAFSHLLSHELAISLGATGALTHEPQRSAAFRVLRQPHAPAALIELGFLSNAAEESQMSQSPWQKRVSAAIAAAIQSYFDQKSRGTLASPLAAGGLPP